MSALLLATLAIGPGLFLTHLAWVRDRHREPLVNVSIYFALGAVAVLPAAFVEGWLQDGLLGGATPDEASLARLFAWTVLGVALVEELGKRLALGARALFDRHLDEPFDWLVYSVAASLGFATLENVFYVFQHGVGTGVARAFTAVPAHAFDGTLMGFWLARAARESGARAWNRRALAVLEPTLWHALYDFPLFLQARPGEPTIVAWLGGKVWIVVFLVQWRVCVRRVRELCAEQRQAPPPILSPIELARRLRARRA